MQWLPFLRHRPPSPSFTPPSPLPKTSPFVPDSQLSECRRCPSSKLRLLHGGRTELPATPVSGRRHDDRSHLFFFLNSSFLHIFWNPFFLDEFLVFLLLFCGILICYCKYLVFFFFGWTSSLLGVMWKKEKKK